MFSETRENVVCPYRTIYQTVNLCRNKPGWTTLLSLAVYVFSEWWRFKWMLVAYLRDMFSNLFLQGYKSPVERFRGKGRWSCKRIYWFSFCCLLHCLMHMSTSQQGFVQYTGYFKVYLQLYWLNYRQTPMSIVLENCLLRISVLCSLKSLRLVSTVPTTRDLALFSCKRM